MKSRIHLPQLQYNCNPILLHASSGNYNWYFASCKRILAKRQSPSGTTWSLFTWKATILWQKLSSWLVTFIGFFGNDVNFRKFLARKSLMMHFPLTERMVLDNTLVNVYNIFCVCFDTFFIFSESTFFLHWTSVGDFWKSKGI